MKRTTLLAAALLLAACANPLPLIPFHPGKLPAAGPRAAQVHFALRWKTRDNMAYRAIRAGVLADLRSAGFALDESAQGGPDEFFLDEGTDEDNAALEAF